MNKIYISDLIFLHDYVEEILDFLEKNSINRIEFFIEPADREYSERLERILLNCSLSCPSFHGPYRLFSLTVGEELWTKLYKDFEKAILLASSYQGEFIVLHTNEELLEEMDKKVIEKRICDLHALAQKQGIKVAVENVGIRKNMLYNEEEYIHLIKKYNFYSLIDIGHAFANQWNLQKVISSLKENIIAYHLHNNDGERDLHLSIYEGTLNYDELLSLIQMYTPEANLVLEYSPSVSKIKLIEDLEKLKEKIQKKVL